MAEVRGEFGDKAEEIRRIPIGTICATARRCTTIEERASDNWMCIFELTTHVSSSWRSFKFNSSTAMLTADHEVRGARYYRSVGKLSFETKFNRRLRHPCFSVCLYCMSPAVCDSAIMCVALLSRRSFSTYAYFLFHLSVALRRSLASCRCLRIGLARSIVTTVASDKVVSSSSSSFSIDPHERASKGFLPEHELQSSTALPKTTGTRFLLMKRRFTLFCT